MTTFPDPTAFTLRISLETLAQRCKQDAGRSLERLGAGRI